LPTQNQKDIASRNDDPDRYVPPSHATGRPVVFTPFKDSEILEYDFLRSRVPVENVMSFSLAAPSPVIANEIQVAFVGNLVRAYHQAVFPIAKYPPSQAYIVPWIRPMGVLWSSMSVSIRCSLVSRLPAAIVAPLLGVLARSVPLTSRSWHLVRHR
jgi:hypothetical protein